MRFEVLTEVLLKIRVFWNVALWRVVNSYRPLKKNVVTLSLGSDSPRSLLGTKIKSLRSSETSVTTSQSTRLTCQRTQVFICTFAVGADDLKSPTESTWYSLCCNSNDRSTENNQSTRGTCNRRNLKRRDWDYLGHRDVGMHFKQGLCGQDSSGEGYCPMSDICEHGNETSDSKIHRRIFESMCANISMSGRTSLHEITERCVWFADTSASYLQVSTFKSHPRYRLPRLGWFVVYLSYFKLQDSSATSSGQGCFLPHPFVFIIHYE